VLGCLKDMLRFLLLWYVAGTLSLLGGLILYEIHPWLLWGAAFVGWLCREY
jgi:hypothetical protein